MATKLSYYFKSSDYKEIHDFIESYGKLYDHYKKLGYTGTLANGEDWVELTIEELPTKAEVNSLPARCEVCGE